MNAREERERVEEILRKRERGERLTDTEQTILAYSPYGTGGGCGSCHAKNGAGRARTEPRDLIDFGADLEASVWLGLLAFGPRG